MRHHPLVLSLTLAAAALAGCADAEPDRNGELPADSAVREAADAIDAEALLSHVRRLASDAFEGRAPGSAGEDSTVAYLIDQFDGLGLQPGGPGGEWTQPVTLVGIRSRPSASITVGGAPLELSYPEDFVAVSYRDGDRVEVSGSELVFVGYGVDAPEYGWDDYAGQDMTGKTLVMLVNDPPVTAAADSSALDPEMFNGEAMTYYGRWTYKYTVGAEKGADAVIIVHETGPAGYPWEVVSTGWGGENFDIAGTGGTTPLAVEAWITRDVAERLFDRAGHDFEAMKERARTPGFEPVPLEGTADFTVDLERRAVESRNVLARLEGIASPEEHIVYTAHWDHLGRDTTLEGDQVYNGALDNATGTAGLLEIAQAYTRLPSPPDRSILFLAVTAEEQGLLGARHYAENPVYPLEKTLANINVDGVNQWGRTEDVVVVGRGASTLDDVLGARAREQGRALTPDPEPEKGFYYRSDHFEFAKQGVPALYIDTGTRYRDRPEEWGQERRDQYTTEDYHQPSDEVKEDWDLSGAVEDLQLLFLVGYDVAQASAWPEWSEGNEFKATREEMLGAAR